MNNISVFLVDDHQLFREGMKLLLSNIPFIGEIREASGGNEFLDSPHAGDTDIVFMDIEMPVISGIETTRLAVERFPGIRIIVLTMYEEEEYYTKMISAGVKGFILTRKKKGEKQGELSEREREVLVYICKGYSNKQIADTLFLSKRTVDKHRENILLKTGTKNTAGLVMYAIQSGIIEL